MHQCAISVQLFDGYDWQKTRKTIEDEIKAVRKRLERIRQLLASVNKADESIEDTRSTLFNSIYIGVDQRNDMDTAALLKAIDDELDGLGDETASQSSWQTMPLPGSAEKRSKVRLRGKRLTRSKKPQIEFGLKGLRAEVDQYGAASSTATRLNVNAASFEILDHIKTSTWKKFLTEMKADSRGNVRETDADMLRLEVLTVRPNLPDPGEEIRVKVGPALSACQLPALETNAIGEDPTSPATRRSRCSGLPQGLLRLSSTGIGPFSRCRRYCPRYPPERRQSSRAFLPYVPRSPACLRS